MKSSGEVELVGVDKEEEDTEEDKNDMIGRKDGQRNDHTRRDWYHC